MLDEYTARNNAALDTLKTKHGVVPEKLPSSVMKALKQASEEVVAEQIAADPTVAKVMKSYQKFQQQVSAYHELSEVEYYKNRGN
jgi:TRAP-type mannitol/chloroaromatic compound transport system substrate-binding protein